MWKVQIPKTESKVEEATLAKWYKKEGEKVKKGELLAEAETFKALIEINSPNDGIIYRILIEEGDSVPVNTVIAIIIEEGEKITSEDIRPFLKKEKKEEDHAVGGEKKNISGKDTADKTGKSSKKDIRIAPAARKLARENEVELSLVKGTGPGGAITKDDIESYLSRGKTGDNSSNKEVYKLTTVQKISADRLTDSYKNIPQFTLFRDFDISSMTQQRQKINSKAEMHLSMIDFIIKALILTFDKFPQFNATSDGDEYNFIKDININLAIATDRGLMVPTLKNLNEKNIQEISEQRMQITNKALEGKLLPEDFDQGTFTITNLGLQGIKYFTPIINPPQVAILGLGNAENNKLPVSLTVDHRIIDGVKGADFLQLLAKKLDSDLEGGEQ